MTLAERAATSMDGFNAGLRGCREPRTRILGDKLAIWLANNKRGLSERERQDRKRMGERVTG